MFFHLSLYLCFSWKSVFGILRGSFSSNCLCAKCENCTVMVLLMFAMHLTWHKSFLSFFVSVKCIHFNESRQCVLLGYFHQKSDFSVIFHLFRRFLMWFLLVFFLFGRKCSTFCLSSLSNSVVNDAPFDRFMGEQPSIQVSNKSTKISQNHADLLITVIISFWWSYSHMLRAA